MDVRKNKMTILNYTKESNFGNARAGKIETSRGSFSTPCFMPVGTRGAVRMLDAHDMEYLSPGVVLANTYHLMLRPGAELVEKFGGLHRFSKWNGHMLTDSGGYQIFSLQPKISAEGATFRSTYDGSYHLLTPESAVYTQQSLGADIQMVLDVCPALPASKETILASVDTTTAWAKRAKETMHPLREQGNIQALFGIVQGGIDPQLRAQHAEQIVSIGFDGYAVGGLSVGESRDEMLPALYAALEGLPSDQPRYLMGVGDPRALIEAIALGVDMFDCVLPTRLARHGTVLTKQGRINIRNAQFRESDTPLDEFCSCRVCERYSKAYIRHLLLVQEPTAARLLTLHNLFWILRFVEGARAAIIDGTFESYRNDVAKYWP